MTRQTSTAANLAVEGLATARLVQLVRTDAITKPFRNAVIAYAYRRRPGQYDGTEGYDDWAVLVDRDPPRLAYLVTCAACLGVQVSLLLAVGRRVAPRATRTVVWAMATAKVADGLARRLPSTITGHGS